MAKKAYDVLHSFTAIIDGKPVRISGQRQAHLVAKMTDEERALLIANGRVREYDEPVVRGQMKRDGLANDEARAAQKAADKAAKDRDAAAGEPEEGETASDTADAAPARRARATK